VVAQQQAQQCLHGLSVHHTQEHTPCCCTCCRLLVVVVVVLLLLWLRAGAAGCYSRCCVCRWHGRVWCCCAW
jgi:hypothetical protein